MIVYLHPSPGVRLPPWLEDFSPPLVGVEVCQRQTERGCLVGVGDPALLALPPARAFVDLDEGWSAALLGRGFNPTHLWRGEGWCRTAPAVAINGAEWQAPVILNDAGERAYLVRYTGRDFLPAPTETQSRCEAIARAAREAMVEGIDMRAGCQWAAVLLAAANATTETAIAELGLLDDQLVTQVLAIATSKPMKHLDPAEVAP